MPEFPFLCPQCKKKLTLAGHLTDVGPRGATLYFECEGCPHEEGLDAQYGIEASFLSWSRLEKL